MRLDSEWLEVFSAMNPSSVDKEPLKSQAIGLMDLTLLDETASPDAIESLSQKANRYHVAAVCVYRQHLKQLTVNAPIKWCTVLNFPDGNDSEETMLDAMDAIVAESTVHEVDYVFPYRRYLAKEHSFSLSQCQRIYTHAKQHGLTFKVILETGAFPDLESIYRLSSELIAQGCDFLKTSTGKVFPGATPSAAFSMIKAIRESKTSCGFKVSGGIRTFDDLLPYMLLAKQMLHRELEPSCFRVGASSLLDTLT